MFPVCYVGRGPPSRSRKPLPSIHHLCLPTALHFHLLIPRTSESMVFKRRENSDVTVEICLCSCTTHSNHLKQKFKNMASHCGVSLQCEHISIAGGFHKEHFKKTLLANVDVQNKSKKALPCQGGKKSVVRF